VEDRRQRWKDDALFTVRDVHASPHIAERRRPPQAWLRGHRAVLVDEAAKHVVTMDGQRRGSGDDFSAGHRHTEVDSTMRALSVLVVLVLSKDSFELTVAQNEQPVEAFGTNRPHPTFSERVGPR
jgi:hypothetical protein